MKRLIILSLCSIFFVTSVMANSMEENCIGQNNVEALATKAVFHAKAATKLSSEEGIKVIARQTQDIVVHATILQQQAKIATISCKALLKTNNHLHDVVMNLGYSARMYMADGKLSSQLIHSLLKVTEHTRKLTFQVHKLRSHRDKSLGFNN